MSSQLFPTKPPSAQSLILRGLRVSVGKLTMYASHNNSITQMIFS